MLFGALNAIIKTAYIHITYRNHVFLNCCLSSSDTDMANTVEKSGNTIYIMILW